MAITERDFENLDPLTLSREIAAVARRVRRADERLRAGEGLDDDPFVVGRIVAGKSAFDAVRSLPPSDPLRRPLERWVYRLAEQRINRGAVVRIAHERRHVERTVSEPEHARLTLAALLDRALQEAPRRRAWFSSFVASAEPLGDAVAMLWERRAEVLSRMGAGDADEIDSAGTDVASAAERWVARTADAFAEVSSSEATFFDAALASGARDGWPRHIAPRTIADFFRETDLLRDLDLETGALPKPYGASSYLRALARVGEAWTDATAPADQPFVVAHDPYGQRRRTMGALFATIPLERTFLRRTLGVDPSRIEEHRRILFGAVLIESRAAALRVLLRRAALAGRRAFRETFEARVADVLGMSLPPHAAGALWAPSADEDQRFTGQLLAATEVRRLREAHDEDWYRNPRACEELRDEASRSPETTTTKEALEQGANDSYASIADALR